MTDEDRKQLCEFLHTSAANGGPFFGTAILDIAAGEIEQLTKQIKSLEAEQANHEKCYGDNDEERIAKRMFEAHAQTTTYGMPWDEVTEPVKKVWLLMAREALDEMKGK